MVHYNYNEKTELFFERKNRKKSENQGIKKASDGNRTRLFLRKITYKIRLHKISFGFHSDFLKKSFNFAAAASLSFFARWV